MITRTLMYDPLNPGRKWALLNIGLRQLYKPLGGNGFKDLQMARGLCNQGGG